MSDLPRPGVLSSDLLESVPMRAALANRDVTAVYRMLTQAGVPQRVIAAATRQSQSEVSEILKGAYDVLVEFVKV